MNEVLKHVNYYKKALEACTLTGLSLTPTLSVVLCAQSEGGLLLTPMFDTNVLDCTFNRLLLEGCIANCKLELIVAASNRQTITLEGNEVEIDAVMQSQALTIAEKATVLRMLPHVRAVNAQDVLLHSLQGQYVWVMVRVSPLEGATCEIEGLRLEFPKYTFTQYFPEIYQENKFFERYIAIFQSVYLDMEREVAALPARLDYESTNPETLLALASWLGIDTSAHVFTPEQLRHMITHIDLFQGGKGTKQALEQVITLVCGIQPKIVERFRWNIQDANPHRRALHSALYGASGNDFCVILDVSQEGACLPIDKVQLEHLIESYTVLGANFQLVLLQKASHCDTHCYLDINSQLAIPQAAEVTGLSLGSYITMG